MYKYFIIIICFSLTINTAYSEIVTDELITSNQDNIIENKKLASYLNISYVLGGKITHRAIVYRSGLMLDAAALKKITPNFQVGIGFGTFALEDEIFIPAFAMLKTNFKESLPSYYFSFKIGYSYANNHKFSTNLLYKYYGGLFIEPNICYQFNISKHTKFNIGIKLISQFGMLSYNYNENSDIYKEKLRFLLIGLNFGLEF